MLLGCFVCLVAERHSLFFGREYPYNFLIAHGTVSLVRRILVRFIRLRPFVISTFVNSFHCVILLKWPIRGPFTIRLCKQISVAVHAALDLSARGCMLSALRSGESVFIAAETTFADRTACRAENRLFVGDGREIV